MINTFEQLQTRLLNFLRLSACLGIGVLNLSCATDVPAHRMVSRELDSSKFVTIAQCDLPASKQADFASHWPEVCPGHRTAIALDVGANQIRGQRLYFQGLAYVDGPNDSKVSVLITSLAGNKVLTHVGATFMTNGRAVAASSYVPQDATRVVISIESYGGPGKLVLESKTVSVSGAIFIPGEMCVNCKEHIDLAIERIREKFLFANKIDIVSLRQTAYMSATGAQSVVEVDATLKDVARLLNDSHSRYLSAAEVNLLEQQMEARLSPKQGDNNEEVVVGTLLDEGVGLVQMKSFAGVNFHYREAYAKRIRSVLVDLHTNGARRWVIDLRKHGGGSTPPLISAMRPLLGDVEVGFSIDRDGNKEEWNYGRSNEAPGTSERYFVADDKTFFGSESPVALLVGPETASSAEALVVAFMGRERLLLLGEPTAGFTTSVYDLPFEDGSILAVATAHYADRRGTSYSGKITPTRHVANGDAKGGTGDLGINESVAWLLAEVARDSNKDKR